MTAPTDEFAQPQNVGRFLTARDMLGHLILVTKVHETFDRHDDLAGKEKLNARFDYVDLDTAEQELVTDALSSYPGIALRLKPYVGKNQKVLGRITQEPSKKPGMNPAFVLGEFVAGDDVKAKAWLDAQVAKSIQQPAPTPDASAQPAVVAAPVAAPAGTAAPTAPAVQQLTQSQADLMTANGIAIPAGTQIIPG